MMSQDALHAAAIEILVARAERAEAERDILKEALRVAREERDARPRPNNYQFVCGLLILALVVIIALVVTR